MLNLRRRCQRYRHARTRKSVTKTLRNKDKEAYGTPGRVPDAHLRSRDGDVLEAARLFSDLQRLPFLPNRLPTTPSV